VWCVWRWPSGVPVRAETRSRELSGLGLPPAALQGRLAGLVAGGRAWGGRGTNSIARQSLPCQAASVRGQSNQVLSAVLRAGRASTAGLSSLSTSDSILMCYRHSLRRNVPIFRGCTMRGFRRRCPRESLLHSSLCDAKKGDNRKKAPALRASVGSRAEYASW
jgi:hypothetical protein